MRSRALAITLTLLASPAFITPLLAAECGKEGRAACKVWERFPPGCDQYLVERRGKCVHPPCGRLGQRPCTVNVRIPSCDAGLIEWGTCVRKGECGAAFQRPCTAADRLPPSCNPGLYEDFGKKECLPARAGHAPFFEGLLSLTNEVGKGSGACQRFLVASTNVQKVDWFGSLAKESQGIDTASRRIDAGLDCRRHMAVGFICATPSQAKKVGAPVEMYNNLADAYDSRACAPDTASGWHHQPARLLGPSRGLDCPYDSGELGPPFFDPLPDPTSGEGGIGSCWACPKFTFRSAAPVHHPHACTRGDERDPQLRAMCAAFTTFAERGVKPLQCVYRMVSSMVAADEGSGDARNKLCTIAGALAFDMTVDAAIGKVDPESSLKKLAQAIGGARKALKGPALLVKLNEEAREFEACKGLFDN